MNFKCSECDYETETVKDMTRHICLNHSEYTQQEAKDHAELWYEDAQRQQEEELRDYHLARKEEDRDD
jgi:C2H2-type zinc-finger domain